MERWAVEGRSNILTLVVPTPLPFSPETNGALLLFVKQSWPQFCNFRPRGGFAHSPPCLAQVWFIFTVLVHFTLKNVQVWKAMSMVTLFTCLLFLSLLTRRRFSEGGRGQFWMK